MWAQVAKWIAQFLLIPLLKDLANYFIDKYRSHIEAKRLEKENRIKGENYEKAPAETAHDQFSNLP